MDFKMHVILLATLLTTGCTDFMHGKADKQETLKIELVDGSCSQDFKKQIQKIANSQASEAEINSVFECVDKYMSQFQNKVEGASQADVYDAQDLLYITNRFFKDLDLSKEIISKIIHLKKALVGGNAESVTRQEVTEIREYFKKTLQPEIKRMSPYFKILNLKTSDEGVSNENDIKTALEQVRQSLKALLIPTHLERSKYSYDDAKELITGLDLIDEKDQTAINTMDKARKLLIGDQELKTNDDFMVFIDNAVDAYGLYLNSCRGQIKFEMTSLDSVKKVVNFFDQIATTLHSSFQFKKTDRISTRDLDEVLRLLMEKKVFPFEIQFQTFQEFYKTALKRVFAQESSEYIAEKQLNYYYKESELFKLQLKYLESLDATKVYNIPYVQQSLKKFIEAKSYTWSNERLNNAEKNQVVLNWIDINNDFYNGYPVSVKNNKYMLMKKLGSEMFSQVDLMRSFYLKILGRQLLMGWGNGQSVPRFKDAKLVKDQMITFTREFKQFGIELKLNDPRSKSDGSKAFLEADLFGFTSNGDGIMSTSETLEYIHYLVTDGAWTVTQIQKDLAEQKCELPQLDVFGNHWNPESCFILNLKHNFSKYFAGKPALIKYLSGLTDVELHNYYSLMMDFSRFDMKNKNVKIETADIQSFIVLSGYVEAMFVKYDVDDKGFLSPAEIRAAYPKFKTFATDYSRKNAAESLKEWDESFLNVCRKYYTKDDLIRESFIFMVLNEGRLPKFADMNYVMCQSKGLFTFKNEIDRKSVVYTFLVLKDVLASDK